MVDLLISYSRADSASVQPIAQRIRELGVDVWFDQSISAGESFSAVINAKLKESSAVLVCWSPTALQSQWVDAEADAARQANKYLPIFLARCVLLPPFNRIHTEDLSNWDRSLSDPAWLKLVDRIATLLGREGIAAAARAFAAGDDQVLYAFARRYPEEPASRRIWSRAETEYRKEFAGRLEKARAALATRATRTSAEAAELDAGVAATETAFETWLGNEQRGETGVDKPDPLIMVQRYLPFEEKRLRDQVDELSGALFQARKSEEKLEAANAQIDRLSGEMAERLSETKDLRNRAEALASNLEQSREEYKRVENEKEASDKLLSDMQQKVGTFSRFDIGLLDGLVALLVSILIVSTSIDGGIISSRMFAVALIACATVNALYAFFGRFVKVNPITVCIYLVVAICALSMSIINAANLDVMIFNETLASSASIAFTGSVLFMIVIGIVYLRRVFRKRKAI